MRGAAFLLLPVLGVLAVDPVPFDYHAVKYTALAAGAVVCLTLRRRLRWSGLAPFLWAFVAVRGAMLLRSPMPGEAVRWWLLLVALVLVHHAAPRRWLARWAPPVLGPLCLAVSLVALGQWAAGARQAHATFANRSFAAVGIAMLLPFALATGWRWLILAAALAGLAATQSRGGALAAAAALALFVAWERPRLRLAALVALPALVLAAGLLFGESNTVKVRLHWYEAALGMGARAPLLGTGAGGFQREYPPVRPVEEYAISGGRTVHAVHDDYLESFAEGGALGLGAHLLLLAAAARAARRDRVAASSLLAFAVASLVDLPLRDPSLLALAFVPLSTVAGRGRFLPAPLLPALVAAAACWPQAAHWLADRAFAGGRLDEALSREADHPEALLTRGRPEDLARLLETWPHHADARYNATRDLPPERAVPALREVLEHDPHHYLALVRLAQLVRGEDPVLAVVYLTRAIEADPRLHQAYLVRARIEREQGLLDEAARSLARARERSDDPLVLLEMLEVEFRRGRDPEPIVRALPPGDVARRVEEALARAEAVEREHPRPRVPREEGEDVAAHVARIQEAQARWRSELDELTREQYREAFRLADALARAAPEPPWLRLQARAARGLGDVAASVRLEATALFLEALGALLRGDEAGAAERWSRALRAHPALADEARVVEALKLFAAEHAQSVAAARRVFARHPALLKALG